MPGGTLEKEETYERGGEVLGNERLLNEATELKNKLTNKRPLPEYVIKKLIDDFNIKNTYHSNAIEGNTLTLYETKVILEEGITVSGKSLREHLEVNNHKEALEYVEELVNAKVALSQRVIKDIHAIVLQGIDRKIAGTYRDVPIIISGANHIPTPYEKIQDEMDLLIEWYNNSYDLHPVERASLLHAKFVNIHPFADGNGHTARLLLNFELMKSGYLPIIIEKESRINYYEALDISGTSEDYSPFTNFIVTREINTLESRLDLLKGYDRENISLDKNKQLDDLER